MGEVTTCPECKELVLVVPAEPDGKISSFNVPAQRMWKMAQVSPSYDVAVPIDVHSAHVLTCKAIHRTE